MRAVEASTGKSPREKLLALEAEINERVFEREEETRGFLIGLIARAHLLFLGPKGCAKSMLGRLLCDGVLWHDVPEGRDPYFRTQLNRDSATDEIFGPVSAKGFAEDTFRRNMAHMLPEAKVALIEEAYRSNPTVLSRLLTIMNEGVVKNGTDPEAPVPLRLLVATTNDLPDDRDDNLDAFHDRFLLRYEVSYLRDPKNVRRMMEKANRPETTEAPIAASVSQDDVDVAVAEAANVDVSPIFDALDGILQEVGAREIEISDRRRFSLVRLIKAQTYLAGRKEAERADLSVLAHALWEEPKDITAVKRIVMRAAHPRAVEAEEIFDALSDSYREAIDAGHDAGRADTEEARKAATDTGVDATAALYNAQRKLQKLWERAHDSGARESAGRIEALLAKIPGMITEVEDKCLKL